MQPAVAIDRASARAHSQQDAPDEQRDVLVQLDENPDLVVRVKEVRPLEERRYRLNKSINTHMAPWRLIRRL